MQQPDKENYVMRSVRLRKPNSASFWGWIFPLLLLIGVGVLGALRGARPVGDFDWSPDFETASLLAKQTHRPLLLEFHTQGCAWCAKMEAETFTDDAVVALSQRFVCVRLDGETEPALRDRYQVMEYPTTVFVDAQGKFLGKLSGYLPPARFLHAEQQILHPTP